MEDGEAPPPPLSPPPPHYPPLSPSDDADLDDRRQRFDHDPQHLRSLESKAQRPTCSYSTAHGAPPPNQLSSSTPLQQPTGVARSCPHLVIGTGPPVACRQPRGRARRLHRVSAGEGGPEPVLGEDAPTSRPGDCRKGEDPPPNTCSNHLVVTPCTRSRPLAHTGTPPPRAGAAGRKEADVVPGSNRPSRARQAKTQRGHSIAAERRTPRSAAASCSRPPCAVPPPQLPDADRFTPSQPPARTLQRQLFALA